MAGRAGAEDFFAAAGVAGCAASFRLAAAGCAAGEEPREKASPWMPPRMTVGTLAWASGGAAGDWGVARGLSLSRSKAVTGVAEPR